METNPNFRVAVEVVIVRDEKVLLTKRADNCKVSPGRWCVPAGKVKYEEIPADGCIREAREETQLDVRIVKEIGVRAFKASDSQGLEMYRLVYTYLTEIVGDSEPALNEEHSELFWATKEELLGGRFSSMDAVLRALIEKVL